MPFFRSLNRRSALVVDPEGIDDFPTPKASAASCVRRRATWSARPPLQRRGFPRPVSHPLQFSRNQRTKIIMPTPLAVSTHYFIACLKEDSTMDARLVPSGPERGSRRAPPPPSLEDMARAGEGERRSCLAFLARSHRTSSASQIAPLLARPSPLPSRREGMGRRRDCSGALGVKLVRAGVSRAARPARSLFEIVEGCPTPCRFSDRSGARIGAARGRAQATAETRTPRLGCRGVGSERAGSPLALKRLSPERGPP